MMCIHYCSHCHHIYILNGHKTLCPACAKKLSEVDVTYMEYVNLMPEERKKLLDRLQNLTVS